MKKIFFVILACIGVLQGAFAQKRYKPAIVVLDAYQTIYDSSLVGEIQTYDHQTAISAAEEKRVTDSLNKRAANLRRMGMAESQYRTRMDFPSRLTLALYGMLTYKIFGQTENGMVIPVHERSNSSLKDLKAIAKKHGMDWVICPLIFQAYKKNGKIFSKGTILVYNSGINRIVLRKEYEGDARDPGFEFSCENGSFECAINNIVRAALGDIVRIISK
jgi:hypothetical protein